MSLEGNSDMAFYKNGRLSGTVIMERVSKSPDKKRITYPQNWRAYNAAQTNEKTMFQILLHDLCKGVKEPPPKNGRRPL
jgi:hypothetical protein